MKKQILKTGKHAGEKKVFMSQEMQLIKGGAKHTDLGKGETIDPTM